jgi:hypothetical protein
MGRLSPHTRWLIGNILITGFCSWIMFLMGSLIAGLLFNLVAGPGAGAAGGGLAGLVVAGYTAVQTWREDPPPAWYPASA